MIKLWSGEKPYLKTGFDAKGMSEGEKLPGIGSRGWRKAQGIQRPEFVRDDEAISKSSC